MSPWFYLVVLIEVPLLFGLAYVGGWWFFLLIALVTLMGMGELYSAAIMRGMRPEAGVGYLCALLLLLAAEFAPPARWAPLALLCLFAAAAAPLAAQFGRTGEPHRLRDCALTTLGVVYVALPMSFFLLLPKLDIAAAVTGLSAGPLRGRVGALFMVAAAVWLCDTAAWAVGHLMGRTKLAPRLSPRKTVEGALAGGLVAVLVTLLVGAWAGLPLTHALALGLLLGVVAQVGDLAESVIKRDLRIRDFGTLLGPHGGMLDTFDGMLFAAPVAWFYLWLFVMA
ncbi:MAG: phosphatidate cytidylyltransferase [Armatimonadota bacterium]